MNLSQFAPVKPTFAHRMVERVYRIGVFYRRYPHASLTAGATEFGVSHEFITYVLRKWGVV